MEDRQWERRLSSLEGVTVSRDNGRFNPLPGKIIGCHMCNKPFLMRKFFGAPDVICPECFTTYKDCAKILCQKCKIVIARVSPEVLDSGFIIRPNSVLHINACGRCTPDIQTSTVVEIEEWERLIGRRKTFVQIKFK